MSLDTWFPGEIAAQSKAVARGVGAIFEARGLLDHDYLVSPEAGFSYKTAEGLVRGSQYTLRGVEVSANIFAELALGGQDILFGTDVARLMTTAAQIGALADGLEVQTWREACTKLGEKGFLVALGVGITAPRRVIEQAEQALATHVMRASSFLSPDHRNNFERLSEAFSLPSEGGVPRLAAGDSRSCGDLSTLRNSWISRG